MGDQVEFDINEALKIYLNDPATIPTPEAASALIECEEDPELFTNGMINGVLNPIVDSVAENPEALLHSASFDSLQFLLKCAPISLNAREIYTQEPQTELSRLSRSVSFLPTSALSKILDLVVSGLATQADIIHGDEADEQEAVQHHKKLLEAYAFLLQWTISVVETKAAEKPTSAAPARRGPKGGKKAPVKDSSWDSSVPLQTAMETMCKVMKLKLGRIFMTTSDRDTFVNLLTRSVYLILESEQRVKSMAIRMHAFKVLCIAVKHHGQAFGMSLFGQRGSGLTVFKGPKHRLCRT